MLVDGRGVVGRSVGCINLMTKWRRPPVLTNSDDGGDASGLSGRLSSGAHPLAPSPLWNVAPLSVSIENSRPRRAPNVPCAISIRNLLVRSVAECALMCVRGAIVGCGFADDLGLLLRIAVARGRQRRQARPRPPSTAISAAPALLIV
uniref:Uncharacterized protein n=1 Tax=Plectus sambesii TaxID=2011161 RepID=A0A914WF84_9BILA